MKVSSLLATIAFSTSSILSTNAAPVDANAAANALEARDCRVNASILYSWGEAGLTRYRIAFSGPATYHNKFFNTDTTWDNRADHVSQWARANDACAGIRNNVQIYYNDVVKSWVVDQNEVSGPAGDSAINCQAQAFVREMMKDTGCGTG